MLSEMTQAQRHKYCMILLKRGTRCIKAVKFTETESKMVVARG